jgi:hypothetical protein
MASTLAPYGSPKALKIAKDLDENDQSFVEGGWLAALLDSLLVFLLLQRRRTLLFFYGFLDESDDLALFG